MTRFNRRDGYSLLELLCAVVVLVILASFLAPVIAMFGLRVGVPARPATLLCTSNQLEDCD